MAAPARWLAVNADDFGFTRDVNQGIIEAHQRGILTSATLMANGGAFEDAIRRWRAAPSLDLGVHFVLVGGPSLSSPGKDLPPTVPRLAQALLLKKLDVEAELRAQMERILAAGVRPTHADTHKHTHLLPSVLDAVARVASAYSVGWVRRPVDFPMTGPAAKAPAGTRLAGRAMAVLRNRFHRVLGLHGCRTTDWFAGFRMTGRFDADSLVSLLCALPPGVTEFMTHPGRCGEELKSAPTRLKESRERELAALTDARVIETIRTEGIRLVSYAALDARAGGYLP